MSRLSTAFTLRVTLAAAAALALAGVGRPCGGAPAAEQTYVGTKKCASCHFEQYMTWKKSKHALSFENMPAKYKTNATCLKCHTTGFGAPTGFKDADSTPDLAGNSCENCHGAGSGHSKICEAFAEKKTLSPAEKQQAKESIARGMSENICAKCHMAVVHKAHEQYEKDK